MQYFKIPDSYRISSKQVAKTFKSLWEKTRSVFCLIPTTSIGAVYRFIAKQQQVNIPALE
jgi:hypothetical protein